MDDHPLYRLGKKPPVLDDRTLLFSTYLTPQLPPPPTSVDLTGRVPIEGWGMMANDAHGDCTCAALGHLTQIWTGLTPTDAEILALYAKVDGGVDQGADMNVVLRTFRKHGFTLPSGASVATQERAHSFVALDLTKADEIKQAVLLFEGAYLGVALPNSAKSQIGQLWTVQTGPDAEPGSWGGHAINVLQYDPSGLEVVTWGSIQRMTWDFFAKYVDEAFAVLPQSFTTHPPAGFNMHQLEADLKAITR